MLRQLLRSLDASSHRIHRFAARTRQRRHAKRAFPLESLMVQLPLTGYNDVRSDHVLAEFCAICQILEARNQFPAQKRHYSVPKPTGRACPGNIGKVRSKLFLDSRNELAKIPIQLLDHRRRKPFLGPEGVRRAVRASQFCFDVGQPDAFREIKMLRRFDCRYITNSRRVWEDRFTLVCKESVAQGGGYSQAGIVCSAPPETEKDSRQFRVAQLANLNARSERSRPHRITF